MNIIVDKIGLEDIPRLLDIGSHAEAFMTSEGAVFWTREQLVNWVKDDHDVLLAARDAGKLVGFVLTALHVPTGKVTWENLYVDPDYRNKGVGTMLIEEMKKSLKAKGAAFIFFAVNAGNKKEIEFFLRRGFKRGFDFAWFDLFL